MADDFVDGESSLREFIQTLRAKYYRDIDLDLLVRNEQVAIDAALADMTAAGLPVDHLKFERDPSEPTRHFAEAATLGLIFARIEAARGRITLPPAPQYAMVPIGQLTAMAVRPPGSTGEFAVLFDVSLIALHWQLARLAVACAGCYFDESGCLAFARTPAGGSREDFAAWLHSALLVFLQEESTSKIREIPIDASAHTFLAAYIVAGMHTFVVGHEYGHAAMGHFEDPPRLVSEEVNGIEVTAIQHAWRQELEADQYGLVLCSQVVGMAPNPIAESLYNVVGGELALILFDMVDRGASLLTTGEEETRSLGTHPPASVRRKLYKNTLGQMGVSESGAYSQIVGQLDSSLYSLWPAVSRRLRADFRNGERVSSRWRVVVT
ncbi:hypothetical protein [Actinomycetospora chiangmaiensis]|uniref:hypothetical protein n=1 Tax=Actinomycetospora chiangmaiensis TaxID=402650 RepID=UPI0012F99ADB|nr:hypothetical protein [Actinomycetospora chiangmaiensis]